MLRFNVARDTRKYSMCTVLGVLFNGEMLTDTFFFFFFIFTAAHRIWLNEYTQTRLFSVKVFLQATALIGFPSVEHQSNCQ